MPHDPYKALYLHIPFCVKRCDYCDFTTEAASHDDPRIDAYMDDLCGQVHDWARRGELSDIETIYIGGGTPTFAGCKRLSGLLYLLSVSIPRISTVEWSIEANPDSISEALVRDIWALGVNRMSIGVQSFDDEVLRVLGRVHTASQAKDAIRCAKTRFENVSIDLMCGIPTQSDESFVASLREAVSFEPTHISVYPLSIEPQTLLSHRVQSGKLPEPDEDVQARHMSLARDILESAGYARYEVASYAKPGFECRHNIAYWTGVPYLGIGRSAATMTQNAQRRMRMKDGYVSDDLCPAQMAAEDLMMGMRMARGISDSQVSAALGLLPGLQACLDELQEIGLVSHEQSRYKPTETGWLCGNELYGRIFDLA